MHPCFYWISIQREWAFLIRQPLRHQPLTALCFSKVTTAFSVQEKKGQMQNELLLAWYFLHNTCLNNGLQPVRAKHLCYVNIFHQLLIHYTHRQNPGPQFCSLWLLAVCVHRWRNGLHSDQLRRHCEAPEVSRMISCFLKNIFLDGDLCCGAKSSGLIEPVPQLLTSGFLWENTGNVSVLQKHLTGWRMTWSLWYAEVRSVFQIWW